MILFFQVGISLRMKAENSILFYDLGSPDYKIRCWAHKIFVDFLQTTLLLNIRMKISHDKWVFLRPQFSTELDYHKFFAYISVYFCMGMFSLKTYKPSGTYILGAILRHKHVINIGFCRRIEHTQFIHDASMVLGRASIFLG